MSRPHDRKEAAPVVCPHCGGHVEVSSDDAGKAHEMPSKMEDHLLFLRNLFAVIAAAMFLAIILLLIVGQKSYTISFIAYGVGALAYLAELVVLYLRHEKHPSVQEVLMPVLFGILYVFMAIMYFISGSH